MVLRLEHLGIFIFVSSYVFITVNSLYHLDQKNWREIFEGEWMVEFYAPWCPACKNLQPQWHSFAERADELDIKVAAVNVDENPVLSGMFFITTLPSIFHVKQGVFRVYQGPRGAEELYELVKVKKYMEIDPLPWYYSPNTFHMQRLGDIIRFSLYLKDLHHYLNVDLGMSSVLSYVIMGLLVLVSGLVLGLLFVLCCDYLCPPRRRSSISSPSSVTNTAQASSSHHQKTASTLPVGSTADSGEENDDSDAIDDGHKADGSVHKNRSNSPGGHDAEQYTQSSSGPEDGDENSENEQTSSGTKVSKRQPKKLTQDGD